jgi:hypothetical protein
MEISSIPYRSHAESAERTGVKMILISNNFRAGRIKDSRGQKVKKKLCTLCLSASLRENQMKGK